jgi:hypothetical protein
LKNIKIGGEKPAKQKKEIKVKKANKPNKTEKVVKAKKQNAPIIIQKKKEDKNRDGASARQVRRFYSPWAEIGATAL